MSTDLELRPALPGCVGKGTGGAQTKGLSAAVALVACLIAATTARAHSPAVPAGVRELLRVQGHKQDGGECDGRLIALSALGESAAFCAAEFRRLALATERPVELPEEPTAIDLQGGRALLARFNKARREQKITLLGEWRPGRRDLFLIAVDLCPEE